MKFIDNFLNSITMYRLLLYYLLVLLAVAVIFSFLGILPLNAISLVLSTLFLVITCWITNSIFAWVYKAQSNTESFLITALILALIITPLKHPYDITLLFWAGVWSMAAKYIFAINRKHVFNPAAIGVLITAIFLNESASWWVGTGAMVIPVLLGGLLIVKKIKRFDLILSFFASSLIVVLGIGFFKNEQLITLLKQLFIDSPILFFAFVMLTEPLTTPPTSNLRINYGILVGALFSPQIHIASLFTTPESALVLGNIFSYLVSPKEKLILKLKEKIAISPNVYDFIFTSDKKPKFIPGQYLEWTLNLKKADSRGNRRYFTIASSPTEETVRIGVKFVKEGSSFKKGMLSMQPGEEVVAGQLAGDFTLPKDKNQKCVLIAGGIGITPFRSMLKDMIDRGERRPITVFDLNNTESDVVYKDVLNEAQSKLGISVIQVITEKDGYINEKKIKDGVGDITQPLYFLSGPHGMVESVHGILKKLGIPENKIKTDLFPGFA